ncbi:hypothetical protein FACS1894178_6630 [Bacteroidia bacterium]|nr:hypothetical protein FACS1894178_6630 [Bacteroidia bacterium]
MKKHCFLLLIFVVLQFVTLNAQDKFKLGTVSQDLLEMSVYEADTTAVAVVIYESEDVNYKWDVVHNDFERQTDYVIRIKILKQQGTDYANVSVSFRNNINPTHSERLSDLTGFTYNFENGKVVKTKLEKKYINTESVTENWSRTKFVMPQVKVGSVIEYKYSIYSPYYNNTIDYKFQSEIPVKHARFSITTPEYFVFNKETSGYENQKVSVKQHSLQYSFGNGAILRCSGEETISEVFDLPAFKDENFVWNYNDFKTGIKFELMKIVIPGSYYKDFSQTWYNVAKYLQEANNFGKEFNNKSILKSETELIKSSTDDVETKLRSVLDLVRSKVKWNEKVRLMVANDTKALKEGAGTSADINSILLNALKNTEFNAIPVVLSTRSNGRLPVTFPSIDNLNYFLVRVDVDGKVYYLDATRNHCDLNVLPTDCLVEKALALKPTGYTWEDLTKIGKNSETTNMSLYFNEDGFLSGKRKKYYYDECAYLFKNKVQNAKDEEKYIESIENNNDIKISNFKIEENRSSNYSFTESYDFVLNNVQLGENNIVMFLPMVFETMKNNPLKSETRKLPLEFNFPEDDKIVLSITIPDGYEIEEMPQSSKLSYGKNNELEFNYLLQKNFNNIQIVYRNKLNASIIPATEYKYVRDFMSGVYAKCNEMIVLKKVSE